MNDERQDGVAGRPDERDGLRAARIERALQRAFHNPRSGGTPPRLAAAMRAAVFGGGGRLRPHLCLAVAQACGDDHPRLADAAAAAVELLHCASLVHDDLPSFDDASHRRGRPTVHRVFGEPAAILAGDALVVLAFEQLARLDAEPPGRILGVLRALGAGVGHAGGIIAGQAWELEPRADLARYHRAKTGALFEAAAVAGAVAAGADPAPWREAARALGEAYQVADDIADALADPDELGKAVQRDAELGRPSAFDRFGPRGALERLGALESRALAALPAVAGRGVVERLIRRSVARLLPAGRAAAAM